MLAISISALAIFSSCQKGFLDKYPSGTLVESNAFLSYENYRSYMYQCYSLFTDKRISSNFSDGKYHTNGQYYADHHSGILSDRDLWQNPYAMQTVATVNSTSNWDFKPIRTVNIMLSHLNDGNLKEADKKHWKSVGYFFHSWWYMELVSRYGDIPYINTVLNDESPEAYGPRTPRKEVADSIIARLEYAIENIGTARATVTIRSLQMPAARHSAVFCSGKVHLQNITDLTNHTKNISVNA